jgi:large subunit ribosomal protein L29
MEIDDLRAMTDAELAEELEESQRGLMNLRFRDATMQLANVREIKKMRTRIARINTLMRERQLTEAAQ